MKYIKVFGRNVTKCESLRGKNTFRVSVKTPKLVLDQFKCTPIRTNVPIWNAGLWLCLFWETLVLFPPTPCCSVTLLPQQAPTPPSALAWRSEQKNSIHKFTATLEPKSTTLLYQSRVTQLYQAMGLWSFCLWFNWNKAQEICCILGRMSY